MAEVILTLTLHGDCIDKEHFIVLLYTSPLIQSCMVGLHSEVANLGIICSLSASQTRFAVMIRARDMRSEEDPDKHNQGGHDSRRNPEEDPGGRVLSQESKYGYQAQMYPSEDRRDADSKPSGSYTGRTPSYTGSLTKLPLNAQVPVYQAPDPVHSIYPKSRGKQEDSSPYSYVRPQPNQEKPKNGPPANMQEQASRHEALPPSGPRHSCAESTTKKTARSSRQSAKGRRPSRYVDDDNSDDEDVKEKEEEISADKRVLYFMPSSGVDIEVLLFYLKRYLGHDSDAEPGKHPRVSIFATISDSH